MRANVSTSTKWGGRTDSRAARELVAASTEAPRKSCRDDESDELLEVEREREELLARPRRRERERCFLFFFALLPPFFSFFFTFGSTCSSSHGSGHNSSGA